MVPAQLITTAKVETRSKIIQKIYKNLLANTTPSKTADSVIINAFYELCGALLYVEKTEIKKLPSPNNTSTKIDMLDTLAITTLLVKEITKILLLQSEEELSNDILYKDIYTFLELFLKIVTNIGK